jgi:hypothetical protein
MKFAVFVGGVGIVFSATMADASPLRPCTRAEIQFALSNPDGARERGVMPGITCAVTRESLGAPPPTVPGTPGGRGSPAQTGIDRSNEPCWIDFPQRRDRDFGQPMEEGIHFGYCPDRVPRIPRPPRPFVGPPRPEPGPRRDPHETTLDEEREYWRRQLLQTLPESTDMLGNPFRPAPSWRQAPWGPGSQRVIAPPRRAVATPDRPGVNSELRLSLPRDGYVAAPSWPIYQPRVPPANIFLPSGPPGRDTGGCSRNPSAAC